MTTNQLGVDLIKEMEGFRSNAYICPAGVPTIGYGTTRYPDGKKVNPKDPDISRSTGEYFLRHDLKVFENFVDSVTRDDINENQFAALVSLCYNIGSTNFKNSTLLRYVNKNPNDQNIRGQFMRWVYAKGRKLNGLIRRRELEANLYFKPITQ
jgi:lysozyme